MVKDLFKPNWEQYSLTSVTKTEGLAVYPADLLSKKVPFLSGHISDHNYTLT